MRAIVVLLLMVSSAAAQTGTTTSTTIHNPPPYYTFEPKDDITASELAADFKAMFRALFCHNVIGNGCDPSEDIEALPPNARRHFVKHED